MVQLVQVVREALAGRATTVALAVVSAPTAGLVLVVVVLLDRTVLVRQVALAAVRTEVAALVVAVQVVVVPQLVAALLDRSREPMVVLHKMVQQVARAGPRIPMVLLARTAPVVEVVAVVPAVLVV